MGHKIKSLIVLMVFTTIISIGLTSNVAYAGLSIAASEFGIIGQNTQHMVIPGPCVSPIPLEGCVTISASVTYDPSSGGWLKELDMTDAIIQQTGPGINGLRLGTFSPGYVIHTEELFSVAILGGNPSGEWSD